MTSADGLPLAEPARALSQERLRFLISALADGEASAQEMDELLCPDSGLQQGHGDWLAYQVIGDVLRGAEQEPLVLLPNSSLAQAVSRRLREETSLPSDGDAEFRPGLAIKVAANDAVFRWKLVAGLASLVAVAAVTWTALGSLAPVDHAPQAGVLAQAEPAQPPATVQTATVQTPNGPVTRDPQLEQLLAQHRQFGGVSAFQMPAGFIRNATYETADHR